MRNENGFTMIELLVVIVVLAAVTLIAMPVILKMINDVKQESSNNAAYATMYAIDKQIKETSDLVAPIVCEQTNGTIVTCKDSNEIPNEFNVTIRTTEIDKINLTYKNTKFSGSVTIDDYEWILNDEGLSFEK